MKLPEYITCATGEVAIAIANYLEQAHGIERGVNLKRSVPPLKDHFFAPGQENEIRILRSPKVSTWNRQRPQTGKGFKTLREFVESLSAPSWKIGCNTITVSASGKSLVANPDTDKITIPKSTLEEMLAALK